LQQKQSCFGVTSTGGSSRVASIASVLAELVAVGKQEAQVLAVSLAVGEELAGEVVPAGVQASLHVLHRGVAQGEGIPALPLDEAELVGGDELAVSWI